MLLALNTELGLGIACYLFLRSSFVFLVFFGFFLMDCHGSKNSCSKVFFIDIHQHGAIARSEFGKTWSEILQVKHGSQNSDWGVFIDIHQHVAIAGSGFKCSFEILEVKHLVTVRVVFFLFASSSMLQPSSNLDSSSSRNLAILQGILKRIFKESLLFVAFFYHSLSLLFEWKFFDKVKMQFIGYPMVMLRLTHGWLKYENANAM